MAPRDELTPDAVPKSEMRLGRRGDRMPSRALGDLRHPVAAEDARSGSAAGAKDGALRRRAGAMAAGVALSRLTGLFREQAFAFLFGASASVEAFVAALRIPNFFRDLLAENVASAAILPTYVRTREKEGRAAAARFAGEALGIILLVSTVIALLGILFAEPFCRIVTAGFADDPVRFPLVVSLTRWLFPFLILVSVAALLQSLQNAEGRFFIPAASTAVLNLVFILVGAGLGRVVEPGILGMAWGALAGGFAAILVLLPGAVRAVGEFRPRWAPRSPEIRAMLKLAVPVVIGVAATDVNVLVNTLMASLAEPGAIAYLNYGYRLMHLPLGLIAVSLGTASLATLANSFARNDADDFRKTLTHALALAAHLAIPAAVGLYLLRDEIIAAVYHYGRFTALDARHTASALAAYAIGIPAFAANRILAPAFYARRRPGVPVRAGLVAVAANIILNVLALAGGFGFLGIALAASAAGYLQTAILGFLLIVREKAVAMRPFLTELALALLGSLLMVGALVAVPRFDAAPALVQLFVTSLFGGIALAIIPLARRLAKGIM
jgi:putative peptidoglycan lipid II flippase